MIFVAIDICCHKNSTCHIYIMWVELCYSYFTLGEKHNMSGVRQQLFYFGGKI